MIPKLYQSVVLGNNVYFGHIQSDASTEPKGCANKWVSVYKNIVGITFEAFNGLTDNGVTIFDTYSADSKKVGSEMLGNMIAEILRVYADSYMETYL